MTCLGFDSYVLPEKYSSRKSDFVIYILNDDELSCLFHALDSLIPHNLNKFRHEELPVMIRLTYYCGLRPGECRCLKVGDVDLDNGVLLVSGNKLRRERYVPMSQNVTDMCKEYKVKLKDQMPESDYFFPNPKGGPYTSQWLKDNFKTVWLTAYPESTAPVRVYSLRHRFATTIMMNWLNNGADITTKLSILSIYMGHNDVCATAYYIHLLPEQLVRSSAIDWDYFNSLIPKVREVPE
jgi:site-specific recombinase XerD